MRPIALVGEAVSEFQLLSASISASISSSVAFHLNYSIRITISNAGQRHTALLVSRRERILESEYESVSGYFRILGHMKIFC